ncbi:MAG: DUF4091 domain-containing protein [Ruminococcaceae bacterium]|nr:DUF4091 domain-containing protein [Oscillospiraceae bacterium]
MKKLISGIMTASMLMSAFVFAPASTAADGPTLKSDSNIVISKDGSYVFGTDGAVSATELAAEFEGEVTVKSPAGETVSGDTVVPTGSTVSTDGGSVKVLISGDVNADGKINLADVATLLKHVAKWKVDIAEDAADVDSNTKVNLGDASAILQYIAKWDVKLGNKKVVIDTEPQTAKNEDESMTLWFDHVTNKLAQNDTTSTGKNTYTIYAAKNEMEDALMYVSLGKDYADLHVSVTDFVNSYGDKVSAEAFAFYYVKMGEYGYLPDAMMPAYSTYATKVKAGNSQGYVIKAITDEETYPGLYEATVSLKSEGKEVKRAKVYLNVWDFTLDDADACDTAFGLSRYGVSMAHNFDGNTTEEEAEMTFQTWYDFLLENRLNGFTLPYDITTEKGQAYLDDPRVHSFVIAGHGYGGDMNRTDEQIAEYHELLSKNPEWLDKGYFYYLDEPLPDDRLPNNKEAYYSIEEKYNLIQSQFEGGWQMIPLETCHGYNLTDDFYSRTKGFVQVYCPKTYAFTPEKYRGMDGAQVFLTAEDTAKYGTFEQVIDSWVADGTIKKLWWYFSCSTVDPYPNYNAESEGILPRVSGWQQYMYDVEGILYYATQEYDGKNPYRDIEYKGIGIYGDGILLYPGVRYGMVEPVGSVRIEYIRDGVEDFMYLRMAERVLGAEKVDEIINKVTRDMLDFTMDTDVLLAARAELAEIIMAAEK